MKTKLYRLESFYKSLYIESKKDYPIKKIIFYNNTGIVAGLRSGWIDVIDTKYNSHIQEPTKEIIFNFEIVEKRKTDFTKKIAFVTVQYDEVLKEKQYFLYIHTDLLNNFKIEKNQIYSSGLFNTTLYHKISFDCVCKIDGVLYNQKNPVLQHIDTMSETFFINTKLGNEAIKIYEKLKEKKINITYSQFLSIFENYRLIERKKR